MSIGATGWYARFLLWSVHQLVLAGWELSAGQQGEWALLPRSGYHRAIPICYTKGEDLAYHFYIGSKLCFSTGFQLFYLPCYIRSSSSWQRWFLSRNLFIWNRCGPYSQAPVVFRTILLSIWGWTVVLNTSPSKGITCIKIPMPKVSLKKALDIRDTPLSYMFPLAFSL